MAGGKETGRQKMIGMMYLVLTALLAMNVSKDILDAFVVINEGLETTNKNFMAKNDVAYAQFESANANDPLKVGKFYTKAKRAKGLADELFLHIEGLKRHLVAVTSGKKGVEEVEADSLFLLKNVEMKDNYDIPTGTMIGSEPATPKDGEWTAVELKSKIDNFQQEMLFLIEDETERSAMALGLDTDGEYINGSGQSETWILANFYHLPLAAVVTNLSKIQADIRNAESDIVKELYRNVSADDFKFDTLAAKVIPQSNYVLQGDSFRADVFVAAFSKTQKPRFRVNTDYSSGNDSAELDFETLDSSNVRIADGMAKYTVPASSEGMKEWGGIIQIKGPDGSWRSYNVPKQTYTVAKPALVVSPTAMNVFYRGLDNPVEVSVPGVPTDALKVAMSNGSKSGSNGAFKVRPGNGQTVMISVSADINGKNTSFGKKEFRVKNVPDPKPYFGGKTGSDNIPRKNLLAAAGIIAKMENFEFDLRFDIISYQVSATVRGNVVEQSCRGPALSGDAKKIIGELKSGQKLYLEKIKAKGPDGTIRDLGTIALKII
ncbi:gliding motility protein GldM [Salibacteraceae bacterium]|nr:gliding motility protein GldM [Salibacteraceae bacterium]